MPAPGVRHRLAAGARRQVHVGAGQLTLNSWACPPACTGCRPPAPPPCAALAGCWHRQPAAQWPRRQRRAHARRKTPGRRAPGTGCLQPPARRSWFPPLPPGWPPGGAARLRCRQTDRASCRHSGLPGCAEQALPRAAQRSGGAPRPSGRTCCDSWYAVGWSAFASRRGGAGKGQGESRTCRYGRLTCRYGTAREPDGRDANGTGPRCVRRPRPPAATAALSRTHVCEQGGVTTLRHAEKRRCGLFRPLLRSAMRCNVHSRSCGSKRRNDTLQVGAASGTTTGRPRVAGRRPAEHLDRARGMRTRRHAVLRREPAEPGAACHTEGLCYKRTCSPPPYTPEHPSHITSQTARRPSNSHTVDSQPHQQHSAHMRLHPAATQQQAPRSCVPQPPAWLPKQAAAASGAASLGLLSVLWAQHVPRDVAAAQGRHMCMPACVGVGRGRGQHTRASHAAKPSTSSPPARRITPPAPSPRRQPPCHDPYFDQGAHLRMGLRYTGATSMRVCRRGRQQAVMGVAARGRGGAAVPTWPPPRAGPHRPRPCLHHSPPSCPPSPSATPPTHAQCPSVSRGSPTPLPPARPPWSSPTRCPASAIPGSTRGPGWRAACWSAATEFAWCVR